MAAVDQPLGVPLPARLIEVHGTRLVQGYVVPTQACEEARVRLRVLQALGELTDAEHVLLDESTQLVRIISTIIRNASG